MRGITLQRLQVFCEVYERNSISAAARALGLSQPTVSKHLRDFEAASGLTLFVLERGRILQTADADAIYSESRFLQDGIGQLEGRIEALKKGVGGKLSVMSIGLLMNYFVPQACASLMQKMPQLRLIVDISKSAHQLELLHAGLIDLGIMAGRVTMRDEEFTLLGRGKLKAIVPRENPLAQKRQVTLEQVFDYPMVDTTARGPIGNVLEEALRTRGLSMAGAVTCNSLEAVPPMAQILKRSAIIDEFTARSLLQTDIVCIDLEPAINFDIWAVTLSSTGNRNAIRLFSDALRGLLAQR
ncbi:LysR family transcriptional regulator [uncultured Thalassospira sp.]|mgnify:FL=1|uniref:LysR family transcriptional regulator n=1 Tax=uncultured Thalassospira sp. TaxID=404382 RepID=UPI0030D7CD39